MSQINPILTPSNLDRELKVEKRLATALWNQQNREQIIAKKAYEIFCSRGCEHGFHLADWLTAEQMLSTQLDDVQVAQSDRGFEISINSIADRAEAARIVLSIAPQNILVLWAMAETTSGEQDTDIRYSYLNLLSLTEAVDPKKAEVSFRDAQVWLCLPYLDTRHVASEATTA